MCAHTGMFRLIRDLDVRLNFLPSPYMYWRGTNRPNNTVRYKHDEWLCVCENVLEVYVSLSNQHESIWTESLVKSPFRARCQSNPTANQGGFFFLLSWQRNGCVEDCYQRLFPFHGKQLCLLSMWQTQERPAFPLYAATCHRLSALMAEWMKPVRNSLKIQFL